MDATTKSAVSLRVGEREWWQWRDLLALSALLLLVAWTAFRQLLAGAPYPAEDAAMLMRYAQHLAQGHGIVWNIGEAPLDGATDFLFMAAVAGLARLGVTVESAVMLLGVSAHALTVALVYVANRHLLGTAAWVALVSAAYLALGPGLAYVGAYFGTPVFALAAAATWYSALTLALRGVTARRSIGFALLSLVLGLIRPEGVLLAAFMLLALMYWHRAGARRLVRDFAAVFLSLGLVYFLWRWQYFGQAFPNPFYKKGGGLYFASLQLSIQHALILCLPFLPAFAGALRGGVYLRFAIFLAIPCAGFIGIWVLMSNEMNYLMRFQYAVLPMVLMSWPRLLANAVADFRLPSLGQLMPGARVSVVALAALLIAGALAWQQRQYSGQANTSDSRYEVALLLRAYADRGYTLATTEAGLLPFYSRWKAIDTWGLNDRWVAHNGEITAAYLDRARPAVIMFHAYFSPITLPRQSRNALDGAWDRMVLTLHNYARTRDYVLAAAFGHSPFDTHYYFVRRDLRESKSIVAAIKGANYRWDGRPTVNYALLQPVTRKAVRTAAAP